MRAFLIAFVCLSTLAMAQNVVVAVPVVSEAQASEPVAPRTDAGAVASPESMDRAERPVPQASTMALLIAGLSGLCAVGNRRHERRDGRTA